MLKKFQNKYLNIQEIYIILFPIAILSRSVSLNLYLIIGSVFFLFQIKNHFKKILNINFKILLLFIIFTILISFGADDIGKALQSSVSQIRFLLFFLFVSILNIRIEKIKMLIYLFSVLIFFIIFDTLHQYFFGYDFFGIKADPIANPHRLSGPFGKELIVGSFICYFSIPVISFFFSKFNEINIQKKIYFTLFIIFSFLTILLSGERISLLVYICSLLILSLIYLSRVKNILIFLSIISLLICSYNINSGVENRINVFLKDISNFKNSSHGRLFSGAYIIWKEKPFLGTGLKNYKINCDKKNKNNYIDNYTQRKILCSTHPHNLYLQLISETGLVGTLIFLIFVICSCNFFLKNKREIKSELKPVFYASCIILLSYVWPVKSSGNFVSTYTASYFWFFYGMAMMCIYNSKKA